jgi:hypothetical protein
MYEIANETAFLFNISITHHHEHQGMHVDEVYTSVSVDRNKALEVFAKYYEESIRILKDIKSGIRCKFVSPAVRDMFHLHNIITHHGDAYEFYKEELEPIQLWVLEDELVEIIKMYNDISKTHLKELRA